MRRASSLLCVDRGIMVESHMPRRVHNLKLIGTRTGEAMNVIMMTINYDRMVGTFDKPDVNSGLMW